MSYSKEFYGVVRSQLLGNRISSIEMKGTSDVSDKEEIEIKDAIQELEEIHRILLDKSSDPIFAFSPEGKYLYVNRAFAEGVSISIDHIIGKTIWDVFDREEADKRYAAVKHVFQNGKEKVIEVRVPRLDGDLYFITTITPIIDNYGKVTKVICSSKDITERKQIETNLRESEEKYRAFFSTSRDSVFITSAEGSFLDFNDALVETLGFNSREELQKVRIANLYANSDERERHISIINELGSSKDHPINLRKRDGTIINTLINSVIRKDNKGTIIGYQGTIRDVTDQKLAEDKLLQSEEKYRLLVSQMKQGLAVHEVICNDLGKIVDYRFIYANEQFQNMTGLKLETIIGKTVLEILPETEDYWIEKYGHVAMTGEALQFENYSKDLEKYYNVVVYCPQFRQFAVIVTDITESKNMEKIIFDEKELLRITLLSVGDGVITTDKIGNVNLLNKVAEQLTGWTMEEAQGKSFEEVFTIINEFTRERCESPMFKVFETGKVIELANHTVLISKDGIETPIEDTAAPIRDGEGNINGMVLVFRDFSEKKRKQEKIEYLSFHDSLTGLYNRRFFEEELKRLDVKRNLPITLIMADVNGLKLANDAFGHLAGDKLLQKASEIMRIQCRVDDIIARIGGDEFVILLPRTNKVETAMIVKRINDTITREKVDLKVIPASFVLSISFGWESKQEDTEDIAAVFKKAEDYMYRRKLSESTSMRHETIKIIIQTLNEKVKESSIIQYRLVKSVELLGRL